MTKQSKIFILENDNVVLSPEILMVPTLKSVYDKFGLPALSYLWAMNDPESPYIDMEEERKKEKLKEAYPGDYNDIDLEMVNATDFLAELYSTPKSRLYDGAKIMLDRFSTYLKNTPLDDDNQEGNFDKVLKTMEKIDKLITNFNASEAAYEKEVKKGRGGKQIAYDL